ncbi:molybdopterin-dependent oxidoreductase [Candidatus Bathyarchaeota archaeon]|nr:molybdopterin-dependent oxidoreductase [Candidatus Bathyarchaeota archaeon]
MTKKNQGRRSKSLPPGQSTVEQLLKWGRNHPTIGVPVPKIDLDKWNLLIDGQVDQQVTLSWNDLSRLPNIRSTSDFHCVEGWSVLGLKWEGILFETIANLAKPEKTAKYVTFECADGYSTSLPLKELLREGVLLAYKLNGKYLEEGTGAPLRLVVPDKYAYKSAMWITRIKFSSKKEVGYWESRGYSDTADVWTNDRFSE